MSSAYMRHIESHPEDQHIPPGMLILHRFGGWLPRDHRVLEDWLSKRIAKIDEREKAGTQVDLDPVIQEFQRVIESNPTIYMGFHEMFNQVPNKPPYDQDPTGKPQVRDYHLMLKLFNDILTTAPEWEDNGLMGFPINAIIDWPMGTPAGYAMFTNDRVNEQFRNMFDVWIHYLTHSDSRTVVPGWVDQIFDFAALYDCDTNDQYYGYQSWDHFFTRKFKDGVRPVDGDNNAISSACESAFLACVSGVKERDEFWLKGQPYSLADILDYNEMYVDEFANGTVYQAFLSATKYHRWHCPVNGVVEDIVHIPGTYYAESPSAGFDPSAPDLSQAFITAMATRIVIYIRSESDAIGLMAFVAVGMSEVSSCEVTVNKGQTVSKGDQLGMFHFGGSTHCLIFREQTKLKWVERAQHDDVLLNETIAEVVTDA